MCLGSAFREREGRRKRRRESGVAPLVIAGLRSNWCLLIQFSPFTHKHRHMMHENTQPCKCSPLEATLSESALVNLASRAREENTVILKEVTPQ